jgi:hypothetical protein
MAGGLFAVLLAVEVAAFWYFYSTAPGRKAVYCAWYAWIIDLLGITSGIFFMSCALIAAFRPDLFTVSVPFVAVFFGFLAGSWQAVIHGVKWIHRIMR